MNAIILYCIPYIYVDNLQIEKHKAVLKEIETLERKLDTMLKNASSRNPDNDDDDENLDDFTSNKSSGQVIDKLEQRKCKVSF